MDWKSLRPALISLTTLCMLGMLLRVIVDPKTGIPIPSPYTFATVPLPQVTAQPQPPGIYGPRIVVPLAQGHYRYSQGPVVAALDMYYVVDTAGDIPALTQGMLPSTTKDGEEKTTAAGAYWRFTYRRRAYFTTCINPRGADTVTSEAFLQNRKALDLEPQRLVAWLLNLEPWYDRRCLWVQASVPVTTSKEMAFAQLETVWQPWTQWWRSHFPAP
jgi:cyanosortase A-associated protein